MKRHSAFLLACAASLLATMTAFAADPYEVAAYYFPGYHPHPSGIS
jgi:hypothetical protein